MAKKDKNKVDEQTPTIAEQRRAEADKGLLERVDTPDASTAPKNTIKGLNGEDIQVADSLVTTSLNQQKAQADANKVENTIKDTYNSNMMDFGARISEMEEAKKNAVANDETAQRRARSMQMVAGISDGLASLANLIGVGSYGASNINTGSALTPLEKKMEAARLERKTDIKSIDDRLDQYRNQLDQVRMQKGSALANYYQQKEKEAKADARHKEEMDYRKGRDAVADKQFTQKIEAMEADREQRKAESQQNYTLALQQLNQAAEEKGLTGSFPVLVGESEILDIPKSKINNETIGRIYHSLPSKYQDLAKGKEIYELQTDAFGNQIKVGTGRYEQPSLNEMLAAIGAASREDSKIQDELRKLAGTYKPTSTTTQSKSEDDDFASYKVSAPISMNYKDNLQGGGSNTAAPRQVESIDVSKIKSIEDSILNGEHLFKGKYKRL